MENIQTMITKQLFSSITGWLIVHDGAKKPLSICAKGSFASQEASINEHWLGKSWHLFYNFSMTKVFPMRSFVKCSLKDLRWWWGREHHKWKQGWHFQKMPSQNTIFWSPYLCDLNAVLKDNIISTWDILYALI